MARIAARRSNQKISIWRAMYLSDAIRIITKTEEKITVLVKWRNPNFIASQMGHNSAQMVYSVYGKWMNDNNVDQMSILNANFGGNAPQMPQAVNQK